MTDYSSNIKLIVLIFSVFCLDLGALFGRQLPWAPSLMASISWNLNKLL